MVQYAECEDNILTKTIMTKQYDFIHQVILTGVRPDNEDYSNKRRCSRCTTFHHFYDLICVFTEQEHKTFCTDRMILLLMCSGASNYY